MTFCLWVERNCILLIFFLIRILSALFGAVLFGIAVPVVGLVWIFGPVGNPVVTFSLVGLGLVMGGLLGYRFVGVFGFIFETLFDL